MNFESNAGRVHTVGDVEHSGVDIWRKQYDGPWPVAWQGGGCSASGVAAVDADLAGMRGLFAVYLCST